MGIREWLTRKPEPVPHADALAGLTIRDAERRLRHEFGYSRKGACAFIAKYKHRIGLADAR